MTVGTRSRNASKNKELTSVKDSSIKKMNKNNKKKIEIDKQVKNLINSAKSGKNNKLIFFAKIKIKNITISLH